MARIITLRDRVREVIRRYKHINKNKFCYNVASDLTRKYQRIRVWYLLNDPALGYSVMKMEYKRVVLMNVSTWTRLHRESVGEYKSLQSIYTQAVLPAINNKGGNSWRFISLLAWAGLIDSRQSKNSKASRANKTPSKRNANARRGTRRRHRNR